MTNPEVQQIREDWIAALRSGDYKRGEGLLRTADDEFCCLGVLCDIVNNTELSEALNASRDWELIDDDRPRYRYVFGRSNSTAFLTAGVIRLAGLKGGDFHASLSRMNDHGSSFESIADELENHPEKYFLRND